MMDVFKHSVECETIIYVVFILKLVTLVVVMVNSCNYTDTIFCVVCFILVPRQKGFAVAAEKKLCVYICY